jgi:hypothetical protein
LYIIRYRRFSHTFLDFHENQVSEKPYYAGASLKLVYNGQLAAVFNGIQILKGRWQHGETIQYCYPSGLIKTLCKWDIYVPLVTKELTANLKAQLLIPPNETVKLTSIALKLMA